MLKLQDFFRPLSLYGDGQLATDDAELDRKLKSQLNRNCLLRKTRHMATFKSHLINNEAVLQTLGAFWNENLKKYKRGRLQVDPKSFLRPERKPARPKPDTFKTENTATDVTARDDVY